MENGTLVGVLRASIGGDSRYLTVVSVTRLSDGTYEVKRESSVPNGGLDSSGDHLNWNTEYRAVADGVKGVHTALKAALNDDVVRTYGKPTKNFTWMTGPWYTVAAKGTSLSAVKLALGVYTQGK